MAGKHRNLVHVGRLSQRREIPNLHVLNHALSKWCHHRKLLCEMEFAGISNSIVSQRAFSAKKISDESEITEEWKEVSGRGTTSRSCYYRGSGLVQCPLMYTWGTSCPSQPHFSGERLYVFSVCFGDKCLLCSLSQGLQKGLERGILGLERLYLFSLFRCPLL